MEVSPTIHDGTEFLDESLWYPSDEMSPSAQSCRGHTPQPGAETAILQTGCSINKIYPLIDNYEKAKVVAAMALNLLVFDGKLHHSRNNWACPFGHCKENFADAQTLMRHVPGCPHFSSDKVYCNCCNKDDCFADQSHNDGFCGGEEDNNTPCHEKNSTMKAKTMRKLTNITGFFTRSRPASRCSSRGLEHTVSPVSSTGRRQSVLSAMTLTSRPSSTPRKQSVIGSPEPARQLAVPGSTIEPCCEMDAVSSVLCEVSGASVIAELPDSELPNSGHRSGAGSSSHRSDSGFSELSNLSMDCTAPMFADMGDMTESPTEDLSMEARIPSWDALQEANPTFSRQVPHETPTSHFPFPSAKAHQPLSEYRSEQHRQSWTFVQELSPQPGIQRSSRSAQCGMHTTDSIPTSNHASFAMHTLNSGFQPGASSSSWEFMTSQYRQGSGDSGLSDDSYTMVRPGAADSLSQPGRGRQSRSCGAALSIMTVGTRPDFYSPPVEMDGMHCPHCSYRPKGKQTGRKANLNKHIKNQHESEKIPCPDCEKEFSRKDNLATHQASACKRRLSRGEFPSARQHAELETGCDWAGGRNLHTAKRVRQDSRGGVW
ncbi:hypothetical protein EDB81DRAFT_226457 [Dactylonectria macrodidyma]|uniref:C2H2-type domain-containing protein n=1 Tax=Dactylonectria macrodidyma TaxID=307937 RepID=A0A9P9DPW9_9HYPO|nr:hypothetical protein EDB81DRAFT_226457 [Dactylonectria macrodidyma]